VSPLCISRRAIDPADKTVPLHNDGNPDNTNGPFWSRSVTSRLPAPLTFLVVPPPVASGLGKSGGAAWLVAPCSRWPGVFPQGCGCSGPGSRAPGRLAAFQITLPAQGSG